MLISLFVLTRVFANPFSNVFQKKLTGSAANPQFIILVTHTLLSLLVLPLLFFLPPLPLTAEFWLNMLICALLAIAGNTLIVAALQSADLSMLGPINSYKSIVSLILGVFILGEYPSPAGIIGILLIVAGSYFMLNNDAAAEGKSIWDIFRSKGILLRFLALIFSATEAIFLKKALLLSSPLITFTYWCLLGIPIAGLAALLTLRGQFTEQFQVTWKNRRTFALLAASTGLMQSSTLFTFGMLQVGYSLALFQTSTLLTVLFGHHYFQEKNILRRLIGAAIMVAGAILIVVFGKQ